MPAIKTEITELATGLGATGLSIEEAFTSRPSVLRNVPDAIWDRVALAFARGEEGSLFAAAFRNGEALLDAAEGLRGRPPVLVEWKGPHRPPGDNVIPADLRIDHVYLVSCKYLSNIVHNPGPSRLFDRLLMGESRSGVDWFAEVAMPEYQALYDAARANATLDLPAVVTELSREQQRSLRDSLRDRELPQSMRDPWVTFCAEVSDASARRWAANLTTSAARLRLFWRLVRVCDASYFVLGAAPHTTLQFRVMSAWDWVQAYELRSFDVAPSGAGQPQVSWAASIRDRERGSEHLVVGHVEIRWSHGRFNGMPEAKVYLDTPHEAVPGYITLS
jgi:hypothetical protein